MRIISGSKKGKKILLPNPEITRPLKDSVKENIFNVLKHSRNFQINFQGIKVLDFFSGSGSFGLECISRGAKKVTFVEQDKIAYETLKKNLKQLSIIDQVVLINDKVENIFNKEEKFNIFFFDPPFADDGYIANLSLLKKNNFFKLRHIVIIHRERNTKDSLEEYVKVLLIKNYGRSKIIFGVFN